VKPNPHVVHNAAGIPIIGQSQNPRAFRLLERLGTNTKVYYLSDRPWVRRAGDNYLSDEKPEALGVPEHHG
ncbi:MAG: 4Fe-4S dicluster domain-containing protein, partial [Desulfatitalea sp.]|nr:4Fe-4S dicluster domain-containing protein [Desulfatitalea sp.]NNJ98922.1 4Fe-4S dicluster domain-containing protein [Desulfatitalea sp.]